MGKQIPLHERFAAVGAAVGRAARQHLPDRFNAADNATALQSRLKLVFPAEVRSDIAFRRGIADLNGLTWASLPADVVEALSTLSRRQLACFVGMMAARARVLLPEETAIPDGARANIVTAENALWDFYSQYPINKLQVGFNAQMYALGLKMLDAGARGIGFDEDVADQMRDNPYFYNILRLDQMTGDTDMLGMMLDDVRAFAHRVSFFFRLNKEQEAAFTLLIRVPEGMFKTPEGKYRMDVNETLHMLSRSAKGGRVAIDGRSIARRNNLDLMAEDTSLDEIKPIADYVDLTHARLIRETLEAENPVLMASAARLAMQFARRLDASRRDQITRDLEDGLLDPTRYARLIASPDLSTHFYEMTSSPAHDTAVTLLVDNSGSMWGDKIQLAYIATRFTARALERAKVPYEILGFTTGSGRVNAKTGRISPLRLIVYKAFEEDLCDADRLAGMLCQHMMNASPTPEGLLWAANRLLESRREKRKLLVSIEDGQPAIAMAEASKSTPQQHMKAVVSAIEARGDIDLAAIGIRHDVSAFYRNSIRIDRSEQLPGALSRLLDLMMLGGRKSFNPSAFKRLSRQISTAKP